MDREDQDLPNPNPAGQEIAPERDVPVERSSIASGYELSDVRLRPILWFVLALFTGAVIVHLVLFFMLGMWTERPLPLFVKVPPAAISLPEVPGPGLDAAPELELQRLLEIEEERLSTYGWTEREEGSVRIPIERAMQVLAESGMPARDGAVPDFQLDPAFRLDSSGGLEMDLADWTRTQLLENDAPEGSASEEAGTGAGVIEERDEDD